MSLKRSGVWALVGCLCLSGPAPAAQSMRAMVQDPVRPSVALRGLMAEVLRDNPQVLAAQAALSAAKARERGAQRPLFNPELELDGERADVTTGFVGINQTVDWGDKRKARARVASFSVDEAESRLTEARLQVAAALLRRLGELDTAQALDALGARRLTLMEEFAALTERRHKAGDIGQLDLELARISAMDASLRKAQTASDAVEAEQNLVAVVGESRAAWPPLPDRFGALDLDPSQVDEIVSNIPAIRSQRLRVAALRATVRVRDRERVPDPTIGVRGGAESSDLLVGINLSVPLFVRNDFRAELDAASADLLEAEKRLQDRFLSARSRLRSSFQRYLLTERAWQGWTEQGRPSLRRQMALLKKSWRAGELDTTQYLVQLTQALETRRSAIELHGRLRQAWFDWLAASGRAETWLGLQP